MGIMVHGLWGSISYRLMNAIPRFTIVARMGLPFDVGKLWHWTCSSSSRLPFNTWGSIRVY